MHKWQGLATFTYAWCIAFCPRIGLFCFCQRPTTDAERSLRPRPGRSRITLMGDAVHSSSKMFWIPFATPSRILVAAVSLPPRTGGCVYCTLLYNSLLCSPFDNAPLGLLSFLTCPSVVSHFNLVCRIPPKPNRLQLNTLARLAIIVARSYNAGHVRVCTSLYAICRSQPSLHSIGRFKHLTRPYWPL